MRRLGAQRVGETWPWRAAGWPQHQEAGGAWTWRPAGRRAASCREGSRQRGEPERRGRGPRPRRGRRDEEEEDDRFKPMPELKLRPILTKPPARADAGAASDSSSAAASPTARVRLRFHARPLLPTADEDEACRQKSRRRRRQRRPRDSRLRSWMYESLVVVKESADPEEDFLESMAEMIAANGVRSPRGLEELLACYIALNAPDHHHAIVAAFRRAWVHLHCVPPPARGRCCMHESRLD